MSASDTTPLVEFNQTVRCERFGDGCSFSFSAASDLDLLPDAYQGLDECPECGGDVVEVDARSFAF